MESKSLTNYQLSSKFADEAKWDQALAKIKLCVADEPENRKYRKLLELITTNKEASQKIEEAVSAQKNGDFEQALDTYRAALRVRTSYNKQLKMLIKETEKMQREFEDIYRQTNRLFQREKYSNANVLAHQLLEITPYNQAILDLVRQIEDKEHAQIFYGEAMALYKRAEFEPAMKKLVQSLELDPDFAAARILLSKIGTSQTCQKYELDGEWKNKKKLQETIQFLEGSIESSDD